MTKIPKKSSKHYVKQQFKDVDNVYKEGVIYELTPEQAEHYSDRIESVSFPALDGIEQQISTEIDAYKKQREQLKTSSRYDSNEAERSFQLQQLRTELDEKISELSGEYQEAVELTKASLAKASTKLDVKPETQQKADDMLSVLTTQLSFSTNQGDVLALFEQQIKHIDDDIKAALFVKFGSVLPVAKPEAKEQLANVYSQLEGAHPGMAEFQTKMKHMERLETDHDPAAAYRTLQLIEQRQDGEQ
jgi:hypothetical protein